MVVRSYKEQEEIIERLQNDLSRSRETLRKLNTRLLDYIDTRHQVARCEQHRMRWALRDYAREIKAEIEKDW